MGLATPGLLQLRVETATDSFLDRTGEDWSFYQHSQELFGGDEIVSILVEGATPFDPEALGVVLELTEELGAVEGIRRVDSLATVPVVDANTAGALSLEPALSRSALSRGQTADLQDRVRRDRIAPRTLISKDERALAINLILEEGSEARFGEILDRVDRALDGRPAAISGVPVFRTETDKRVRRELGFFVPLTVLCIGVLLYVALGSLHGVALPLLASAVGIWITAGVMGASHRPITIVSILLPSILLANGCAYCVHMVVAAMGRQSGDLEDALVAVALPLSLSGTTTALGFIASSVVPIDGIRDIGVFGGFGVLVLMFAALTLIPSLIRLSGVPRGKRALAEAIGRRLGGALVSAAGRPWRFILTGWVIALSFACFGITRLQIETDAILWFQEGDPVRADYERIRDRLSGISPMNVVIESQGDALVSQASVIEAVDRLVSHLETLPQVGRAISIADPLRQLHGGFIGAQGYPLPMESSLIEQYLLLLEAKPYTRDLITPDRSAANVVMRVDNNSSEALLSVAREVDRWWEKYGAPGFRATTTGIMYEFARSEDTIAWGQLRGLATAFIPIAAVLFAIFRSFRLTIAALIPNTFPIAIAYGAMGLLGVPLDAGTVVLGSLALGIAVDDTIHVAEGYLAERGSGESAKSALLRTYERSLPAICFTTGVITLGFLVLAFSTFTLTRNLGIVMSALMVLCLLADLLLFAPLLMRFLRDEKPRVS